jgi:hypothetical protein
MIPCHNALGMKQGASIALLNQDHKLSDAIRIRDQHQGKETDGLASTGDCDRGAARYPVMRQNPLF